jgi:hypothetical protein
MHNFPINQLAEWKKFEKTCERSTEDIDLINDYFDCLIECDDKQSICKKVCRDLLN